MAPAAGLSGWLRSRWERFDGPHRLAGVDLARGLAVVGMLAAHLIDIGPIEPLEPATWLDVVNGRSSILFATLAGVSIALVTGGREPVRGPARARASARLALRAVVLWGIGLLLVGTGVPVYVILPAYGILFLLSLPFIGLRARALFPLAGVLAVVMPFAQAALDAMPFWVTPDGEQLALAIGWHYPFPTWIAFLLAGMAIGRTDLRTIGVPAVLAASGAVLAVVAYGLGEVSGADPAAERLTYLGAVWTARAHSSGLPEVVGSGGFAIAVIGLSILVCRTIVRWAVVPLRAVGSMPLTAYCAQLIVWAVVAASLLGSADELDGFRALEPFWPMTLGIVAGCTVWALLVGRGPLEAAIDRLARWVAPDPAAVRREDAVDRLGR